MSDSKNDLARDVDASEAAGGSAVISLIAAFPLVVIAPLFVIASNLISGEATETPPESRAQQQTAETANAALDLSAVWPVLGLIAAGIGVLALGAGAIWGFIHARRRSLALGREREELEEDRRQALAVWQKFVDRQGELKARVLEIETDWELLFSYPALQDPSVPQTRELHRALRAIDSASSIPPSGLNLSMDISSFPYPRAVSEADAAWERAWSFAQRTGLKLIPKPERKKIDQIVKLLKLARDGGGSEHERSVAYERVAKLVGELQFVKVPEAALKSIDSQRCAMIEAPARSAAAADPKRAERVFAV